MTQFDIERSSVYDRRNRRTCWLLHLLWLWYRIKIGRGKLSNALACQGLLQGWHQSRHDPGLVIALGGLTDLPQRIKELARPGRRFLLGGCAEEQAHYLKDLEGRSDIIILPTPLHTLDEIKKAIVCIVQLRPSAIGVITHETHCARALLTLIKQLTMSRRWLPIVPFVFIDNNHLAMDPHIQMLGILREAEKIARYQKRGDVATLAEAIEYYQAVS